MKYLIRCDASYEIGSGHVMRCLTIAHKLKALGHQIIFWMEPLPGNLILLIQSKGFIITSYPQVVDVLIVDHYGLDEKWEASMRKYAKHIIVVDDLADRAHDCDILLDQNVVENFEHRYDHLVPEHCKKLLGPKYLLLRDEFISARNDRIMRTGAVNRLLIFMGGSDPTGETLKVMHALQKTKTPLQHVDVVVGSSNPDRSVIEEICNKLQLNFHCQIDYMAELMSQADFSIGAGGATTWERCYVGLPAACTVVADNQRLTTDKANQLGAIYYIGWQEEVTVDTYHKLLDSLPQLGEQIKQISQQGLKITENHGQPNPWLQEMVEWEI